MRRACSALVMACAVAWIPMPSRGQDDNYPVRAEFKAAPVDARGRQTITVVLTMKSGWQVYGNPIGSKDLAAGEIKLTVKNRTKASQVTVIYPPGEVVKDAVIGDYRVFNDKATLQAIVERRAGNQEPLEVDLFVHPCNHRVCIQPKHFHWTQP